MDPLTQGVLGAALPQSATGRKIPIGGAGVLGFLAGMAADLDVFIRSETDPLLFLEYHRYFTHSLAFIPIGGLLCALVFHWLLGRRWGLSFWQTFLVCTLGYATHGLLDAATSYGTSLYWPFSDERVSASIISIIDPLFTLPLMVAVIAAAYGKKPVIAWAGLGWAACYFAVGFAQQSAAITLARKAATERGHMPLRIEAKPSFGNILIWKTITETTDRYYVDGARAGFSPRFFPGISVPKLNVARDLPWLDARSQQAKDIERFRFFSQGYVAQDPEDPNRIIDVRYSFMPNEVRPLWFITVSPEADKAAHVSFHTSPRNARENLARLWQFVVEP